MLPCVRAVVFRSLKERMRLSLLEAGYRVLMWTVCMLRYVSVVHCSMASSGSNHGSLPSLIPSQFEMTRRETTLK